MKRGVLENRDFSMKLRSNIISLSCLALRAVRAIVMADIIALVIHFLIEKSMAWLSVWAISS